MLMTAIISGPDATVEIAVAQGDTGLRALLSTNKDHR